MNNKRFSIAPKNEEVVKKALDHFDQEDQKINGDDVRGGNWTEYGGGQDKDDPTTTSNRLLKP
ncbi:hypothetical protein [Spirosoma oryzicola]|uniref:hypothetical protein n=1 Tax=Spirosoma oryzicola TaxID=2898794 RepID=UPI001E556E25|nr:hypothetical protein [Spirosoma oryzicola]UHG94923.1 hypothetical protein LQ777_29885 [Spirosoma oryzicola]